jgi:epoxyqueuosine reductase QueG
MGQLREMIRGSLEEFVREDPRNVLPAHGNLGIYDPPLVAFARADDPLFEALKDPDVVGPRHRSPREWLPSARTVVSYFLPFTESVRKSNHVDGLPSEEWVSARIDGEAFNNLVRWHCAGLLESQGGQALVPPHRDDFAIVDRRSNWSERHVAYIAGLGTFGLSRSLITSRGTAGRYGSVVTSLEIEPTSRTSATHYDACPFLVDGGCGACIDRCPSGAITRKGKDTARCSEYLDTVVKPRFSPRYGCAKCQTNVPCEFATPG